VAAGQLQGVEKLGAAERLGQHFGGDRAGVVVHHVVGAQQHVHRATRVAQITMLGAVDGLGAVQHAQLHVDVLALLHRARQERALANKISHEAVGRLVVQGVGAGPLLDMAVGHDADLVGDGKRLVLVVCHQQGGGARGLEQRTQLAAQALTQLDIEIGEGLVQQQQAR